MPAILQRNAVTQRIGREIQGESARAELVRQHVAGMAHIRSDLEKRRHRPDKRQVIADYSAAPRVLLRVMRDGALRLAQRREIVKFDFRPLDRERLRLFQNNISGASDRKSARIKSGWCARNSSMPASPVATASTRTPLALAASTSFG